MIGRIVPKDRMALRVALGEAHMNGNTYWVEQEADGSPVIVSQRTQKQFVIGWSEIIFAAIEAGIDNTEEITMDQSIRPRRKEDERRKTQREDSYSDHNGTQVPLPDLNNQGSDEPGEGDSDNGNS